MRALVGYVWRDALRSQGWTAPILTFAIVEAIFCANSGSVLPTYAGSATLLLFIAAWVTIVTINSEDPVQLSITIVCAGGGSKVRLAKLVVALVVTASLGIVAVAVPPFVSSGATSTADMVVGLCAQLLTAITGVALGSLCSRPIITRGAWSVLVGVCVSLVTVIVPYGPPTRQLLVLLNKTGSYAIGPPLAVITIETVLIALVAVTASLRVARRIS